MLLSELGEIDLESVDLVAKCKPFLFQGRYFLGARIHFLLELQLEVCLFFLLCLHLSLQLLLPPEGLDLQFVELPLMLLLP